MQDFLETASVDWILMEQYVDKPGYRSHRAIDNAERVKVKESSTLYKLMDQMYQKVSHLACFEVDNRFDKDCERGYSGYKLIALKDIEPGDILGVGGVVSYCPDNIDETEFDFSLITRDKISYCLQGPVAFVNHSCVSNCKYREFKGKPGIVDLTVVRKISQGHEITVDYGRLYFGPNKEFCQCPHKKEHQSKLINQIVERRAKTTRSGHLFASNQFALGTSTETVFHLKALESGKSSAQAAKRSHDETNEATSEPCRKETTTSVAKISRRSLSTRIDIATSDLKPLFEVECEFCPQKVILTSDVYLSHMKNNHRNEAVISCPLCPRSYGLFKVFSEHITDHIRLLAQMSSDQVDSLVLGPQIEKIKSKNLNRKFLSQSTTKSSDTWDDMTLTSACQESSSCQHIGNVNVIQPKNDKLKIQTFDENFKRVSWPRKKLFLTTKGINTCCKFENCNNMLNLTNYDLHLKRHHGLSSSFECPFCLRMYGSIAYLRRHVIKQHQTQNEFCPSSNNFNAFESEPSLEQDFQIDRDSDSEIFDSDLEDLDKRLSSLATGEAGFDLILECLSNTSCTYTQVFKFVSSAENVCLDLIHTVDLALNALLTENPSLSSSTNFSNLKSSLSNFNFTDVRNQMQLIQKLKKQKFFILPQEITLGQQFETRSGLEGPEMRQVHRTFQFISISSVLKSLFQHENTYNLCVSYSQYLASLGSSGLLFDQMQLQKDCIEVNAKGKLELNLSLQLYFDEVEPANPIGTHAVIHKLGFFYWSLASLPRWLLSNKNFLHVFAVISYLDIETYGFAELTRLLKEDLMILETGILVETRTGKSIKLVLKNLQFVADNLAYHAFFGFNRSFSQGNCCEKCSIPVGSFKYYFSEKFEDLRTVQSCKRDAMTKTNGVKFFCDLELKFFSPYENFTTDIHHDIFQGSLYHVMRCVLNEVIPECFTIQTLNSRINSFDYGRDVDGKPSEFDLKR